MFRIHHPQHETTYLYASHRAGFNQLMVPPVSLIEMNIIDKLIIKILNDALSLEVPLSDY